MNAEIRIGMSGWTYPPWRGTFYPEGLLQKKELEYASKQVTSIEINGTFYSMQKPESFITWHKQTPADFKFAIKAPRYITHVRRLKEIDSGLANLFATGILRLEHKLGVILWQFPPFVELKDSRFEDFFGKIPRTAFQAAEIAKNFSPKIKDIVDFKVTKDFPIHHVFEFRNYTFFKPDFIQIMKKNNVGLVIADSAEKGIYSEDLTSDVVYLRMHGLGKKYAKGYSKKDITALAEKVKCWSQGKACDGPKLLSETELKPRSVYVYFDNDAKEYAPSNAQELMKLLK